MEPKNIQFLKIFPLRGPSMWTYRPILEVWVDIGGLEDCPSNTIPGFVERLCEWLPSLSEHRCSYGVAGGFVRRLQEGTWPAHILEHVTLELQNLAGVPGGFGKARETGVRGIYKVVVSAWHEGVTRASLDEARELVMAAIEDRPFEVAAAVERLREMAARCMLGPSTACIVQAAEDKARGIPCFRLSSDNLVQLGYGVRQRRIWAAETDLTGAIAEGIARDPDLSHQLLKTCGLPVPSRSRVESVEEAWEEAQDMGLPVRVLPLYHDAGEVGVEVTTQDELVAVYPQVAGRRTSVMLEKCVVGKPHRLLIVGGKLVAAARLDAGYGTANVAHAASDVTADVHADTASAACLAAKIIGLDIAGVDMVLEDVRKSLSSEHGAVMGVHAGPGLLTHLHPAVGDPRPVGRAIIDGLFPGGSDGRIPVVGVTGTAGATAVARLVAEFLRLSGKQTGLACGDGMFFNRRQVESDDCANWSSGRRVLMNPSVEAAVIENSPQVILGQGLAYDRCQVGVVTHVDPDERYLDYHIDSPERVFQVLRTQVDVVLATGVAVLDAQDPRAEEFAKLCDGEVIYFSIDPEAHLIIQHLADGGRAVTIRNGELVILATGVEEVPVAALTEIPFIVRGCHASLRISSLLAAVAAAWGLGIALHVIRTGVETFANEPEDSKAPSHTDPAAASIQSHRT